MLIVSIPEEGERVIYYQGDILEESETNDVFVVSGTVKNGLEMLSGSLHPRFGFFMQDADAVPTEVSWNPTGFSKIGIAPSFFPGAMVLK